MSIFKWISKFVTLFILFAVLFVAGSMAVSGMLPENAVSEPGLVSAEQGFPLLILVHMGVLCWIILSSRLRGWRLALGVSLAYYGAVTFLMQIETWYFLSSLTVSSALLPRLFIMGLPTAFLFVPLAVFILGRWRGGADTPARAAYAMPAGQWIWKLATLATAYVVLYWCAGYFLAWQNPALRAFYGSPGDALPFWTHTANTLRTDPFLLPFQLLRGLIWTACAYPVIRFSTMRPWQTAILVGVFLSVPQNIGHIVANPLIPVASVRLSHLIETASSTFLFGTLIVWLLHREHRSAADLFGRHAHKEAAQ